MEIPKAKLVKYEDKWRDDSPDYPVCAYCSKKIGSEEEEEQADETYEPEIPLRIWREKPGKPGQKQELCFHIACASEDSLI